MKNKADQAA